MLLKGASIFTVFLFLSNARGFPYSTENDEYSNKIYGNKAENRQFPYLALIVSNYNYNTEINTLGDANCGGAVLSDKFVITSGLCVEGTVKYRIKLGAFYDDITDNKYNYVYDHVMWSTPIYSVHRMVALITLNPRCAFTPEIQPVTLEIPIPSDERNVNNSAIISDWRINKENQLEIQWSPMQVIDNGECWLSYPTINEWTAICVQGDKTDGKRTFCGRPGAVLVAKNHTLIGISIQPYCSEETTQLFARIEWFTEWIRSEMEK